MRRNMPHLNGPPPISDEDLAKFEDVVADRELISNGYFQKEDQLNDNTHVQSHVYFEQNWRATNVQYVKTRFEKTIA